MNEIFWVRNVLHVHKQMSKISIELPVSTPGIDEVLSKGLSDVVGCLFVESAPIPFSNVKISSVPQDVQPVPAKWQVEVAIEDDAVFFDTAVGLDRESTSETAPQIPRSGIATPVQGWVGQRFFEQAVTRLGLTVHKLSRLTERDDEITDMFGPGLADMGKAKKLIKNELKEYDTAFKAESGRDPNRVDKEPMRLLYTLYRKLRDIIVRIEASSSVPAPSPQVKVDPERAATEDRLEALYNEKQQVRTVLQEYQTRFLQEQGRRIKYHRDIVAVDREYRQYKQLKEEIAKLETLLGRAPQRQSTGDFFP